MTTSIPFSFLHRGVPLLLGAVLWSNAHAGTINITSASSTSTQTSETTTMTFVFTPSTTINSSNWSDGVYFWIDLDDDYVVSASTLVSISPNTGMNINNRNDSNGTIRMYGNGAINAGTSYTVIISGIQNPATAQTPSDISIRTGDGSSIIDTGTIAAEDITLAASNPPTVSTPLSNYGILRESDGQAQHVADLNDHFVDGDGDTLTFSASSSNPAAVAVTLSGANNRTLSLEASKYGTATITVTATSSDGSVQDDFTVTGLGVLAVNSISSSVAEAGELTDITVNFTVETTIDSSGGDGAYVVFDFPSAYNTENATVTLTSPSVAGATNTGSGQLLFIANASTIAPGTYTAVLGNVRNPGSSGSFGNLEMDTRDGGSTVFQEGAIALPAIDAVSVPTVTDPLPNQTLYSEDGQQTVIANLNDHFTDNDGDNLTFSILAGHDTSVVTASISGDSLRLTGGIPGTTTVTVQAEDGGDGSVTDSFDVTVVGLLTPANLTLDSLLFSDTTQVTVELTPSQSLVAGDQILVQFPTGFDVSGTSLASLTGASPGINFIANSGNFILQLTSGSVSSGTSLTLTVDGLVTPSTQGTTGNYILRTQDSSDTVFALATLAGHDIVDEDSDDDGLDDEWERMHFGSISHEDANAGSNPDEDPYTTFEEFIADTDPDDENSFFGLTGLTTVTGDASVTISWSSSTTRLYRVYRITDLVTDALGTQIGTDIPGDASGTTSFTDTSGGTYSPVMYRVEVYPSTDP